MMVEKATKKKGRKMQGRDWHGWAWKTGHTLKKPGELFHWAEPDRPAVDNRPSESGKWVRVRFVEVD